tara:strand:+ start:1661 stop:1975 length:315 start_codon:yes stop_codon:yes gene_type:complete
MENIIIVLLAFLIINIFWHSFILKKNTFFNDLKNPRFIIYFIVMIGFTIWSYNYDKYKDSSKHGLIAFITAYLAHLDLLFSAYILAWLITYLSDNYKKTSEKNR